MRHVEDLDIFSVVIDRINDPAISDPDAVEIAVGEFLCPEWPWMDFKLKEFWQDPVLQILRELLELALRAGSYLDRILAQFLRPFLIYFTNV